MTVVLTNLLLRVLPGIMYLKKKNFLKHVCERQRFHDPVGGMRLRNSTSEKVNKNLVRIFNWSGSRILLADNQGKPMEEEIPQLKIWKFHFWLVHWMHDSLVASVSSLNLCVPLDFCTWMVKINMIHHNIKSHRLGLKNFIQNNRTGRSRLASGLLPLF